MKITTNQRQNKLTRQTSNKKPAKQADWGQVLDEFRRAGKKDDQRDFQTRIKDHLWRFPKGKLKGFIQGLRKTLLRWIRPRSDLYQPNYKKFLQEIESIEGEGISFLTEYAQKDWEERGEMLGESTVTTGQWLLKWIFAFKGIRGGLIQVGKKW